MTIESRIHCGVVIACRRTERAAITKTVHTAGSRLPTHAHSAPHLVVLLEGAYFERVGAESFLRLPGDEVYYPEFFAHENRFGRMPATCLNVQTFDGSIPSRLEEGMGPAGLERIRDLVRKGEVGSLNAAAREAGYHPVYLSRIFRKAYGVSFGQFLRGARIRKSADLILRTDLPLAEIALEAGYYDQSHLSNELASRAGFTPGELRRLASA